MQRNLGFWESTCKLAHDFFNGTGNVTAITELNGIIDKHILLKAIEYCFHRHPLLRAIIRNGREGSLFDLGAQFENINIELLDNQPWRLLVEKSLNQKFQEDKSLWRLYLVTSGRNHHLIITGHHAICDGLSLLNISHEILTSHQRLQKESNYQLESLPLQPNIEQLLVNNNSWSEYIENVEYFDEKIKEKMVFQQFSALNERHSRNLYVKFSAQQLDNIKRLCKKHHVTVNAFLNSTLLLCYAKLTSYVQSASLNTPINLRPYCKEPLSAEHIGCNIAMVRTFHKNLKQEKDVWHLARCYQKQLLDNIPLLGFLPKSFDYREFDIPSMMNLFGMTDAKKRSCFLDNFGISNLGVIPLNTAYGDLQCKAFNFCTNRNAGDFGLWFNVTTFKEEMSLVITYVEPLMNEKWVQSFCEYFETLIIYYTQVEEVAFI